jgi:hypothetical protein
VVSFVAVVWMLSIAQETLILVKVICSVGYIISVNIFPLVDCFSDYFYACLFAIFIGLISLFVVVSSI